MSDPVFVKNFSRRRFASDQSGRPDDMPATNYHPESRTDSGAAHVQNTINGEGVDKTGDETVGGLSLDQSVASTAAIWIDTQVDQVSRADYAEHGIPRPHLEPLSDSFPDQESEYRIENRDASERENTPDLMESKSESHHFPTDRQESDVAQQIQQVYASTVTDAASFVNEQVTKVAPEEVLRGMRQADPRSLPYDLEIQNASPLDTLQPVQNQVESRGDATHGVADSRYSELIIENPFAAAVHVGQEAPPAPKTTSQNTATGDIARHDGCNDGCGHLHNVQDSGPLHFEQPEQQLGMQPFQAVWEVDVLDVPTVVADLFFEGALFQQIAERMSDAIMSGLHSVIVTSIQGGEGRSSVAIGLAMAAAASGRSVALVDANVECPKLGDELRLDLQYGWVDTIRAGLPIKEIAVHAVEDGVTLIPLMPPKGKNAATGHEVVQLLELLKDKFELIIVDGPTAQSTQIHHCASAVDSAIIVRDMQRTDTAAINEFSYRLRESGAQGVGVVENFI